MLVNDRYKPNWRYLKGYYDPLSDDAFFQMTDDEQREQCLDRFVDFAYRVLTIRPKKAGEPIPLLLNREQRYLLFVMETQMETLGFIKLVLLKSRQFGGSTLVGAYLFWMTIKTLGFKTFILSHEDKSTQHLFDMVEMWYENANELFGIKVDRSNVKELRFTEMHSGYKVGTAGSRSTGRSQTLQAVHWSEMASSQHADEHRSGLLQAIPKGIDAAGTVSVKESTAKGIGGAFHSDWLSAMEESSNEWACFIPWWWHEKYRNPGTECNPTPAVLDNLDEEELMLIDRFNLDSQQLQFRRDEIIKPSGDVNGVDFFKQEYPSAWAEAFLHSGALVFDASDLTHADKMCATKFWEGDITPIQNAKFRQGKREARKGGPLRIFKEPTYGSQYLIAADTAEGESDGDNLTATVIDVFDGVEVATYQSNAIGPVAFGDLLCVLAHYYNKAQLVIEVNFADSCYAKCDLNGYANLYKREHFDDPRGRKMKKGGWKTTTATKRTMVDFLSQDLKDDVRINDTRTVSELWTFVRHENGSLGASPGCKDDLAISRMIAGAAWRQHNKYGRGLTTEARESRRKILQELRERQAIGLKAASSFRAQKGKVTSAPTADVSRDRKVAERKANCPGPQYVWSSTTQNWHLDPRKSRVIMPSRRRVRRFGG